MKLKYQPKGICLKPTSPGVFFGRREFLERLALGTAISPLVVATLPAASETDPVKVPLSRPDVFPPVRNSRFRLPVGLKSQVTPRQAAARYNNFYEFLPDRGGPVWKLTEDFQVEPWKIEVDGECRHPMTLDLYDLFRFEHEERLYHFRCVERWAMNVPWSGFPLRKLIERALPNRQARFVAFETARRPDEMPGVRKARKYPWPYQEALRIDEAMHELVLVATGVYGEPLLKQHGAPARIVVPWKYGFKSPKSVVRIRFLSEKPSTFWGRVRPHEYGFISNVNPNIPHPRWSQQRSFWLGSAESFPTPIFNGYEEYVSGLYPDEPGSLQEPLRTGEIAR